MKKILLVVLAVVLMLAYVWIRSINNRLTENVAGLEQEAEILEAKLEREQIELSKKMVVTELEPRARQQGMYYSWEIEDAEEGTEVSTEEGAEVGRPRLAMSDDEVGIAGGEGHGTN